MAESRRCPPDPNTTLFIDCGGGLVTRSCPTLCDPLDCSPPGSSVHAILQPRILEGLPFPSPGNLPDPGIKPRSPTLQTDSLPTELPGKPDYEIKS